MTPEKVLLDKYDVAAMLDVNQRRWARISERACYRLAWCCPNGRSVGSGRTL